MSQDTSRLSFCVNQTFRDVKQMDQIAIVLYLDRKKLSAIAIHYDLVVALGPEPVSYSSVPNYLCEAIFVSSNCPANIREAELQFEDCDQAILLAE
jgi:hypothetical protein